MIQIKYPRIILVSPSYSNNITIISFLIQHTLKEEVTPQKKILSIIMCKHSSRVTDCQSTKSKNTSYNLYEMFSFLAYSLNLIQLFKIGG